MKKYEYKFVEVKKQAGLAGVTFEECKKSNKFRNRTWLAIETGGYPNQ